MQGRVSYAPRDRAVRKAGAVEGGEEEVTRAVAGEESAGPVGPVGGRSETEDDDLRPWVTEAGNGAAPVRLVFVGGLFLPGDLLAPFDEARAAAARSYLPFECREPGGLEETRLLLGFLVQAP